MTTHLEASRTPVNKLDRTLRFDASNCCRRVLGHNVATVKQANGHYQTFESQKNCELESHVLYFPSFGSHFTYPRLHLANRTKRHRKRVYHLCAVLEAGKGHLCYGVLFVGRLLRREERSVGSQGEVDAGEAVRARSTNPIAGRKTERITHGTRLVWNSFRSTLREPSKRREAVMDETTCAISRFRFVKLGCATLRRFLQIS